MKKLLSILGAVGLVATASTSVVACGSKTSNNPNYGYKDFEGWVNESKKDNINEIVFVGGRKDVDTLSFLAARQQVSGQHVDTQNINSLTDNKKAESADNSFNEFVKNNPTNNINQASTLATQSVTKDQVPPNESTLVKNYFWDNNTTIGGLKLHSVLVDDIASFFKNGLGSDIINKFIKNQVKELNAFAYSTDWNNKPYNDKNNTDKEKQKQIDNTTKSISDSLQANQGPFFLVISNGKLAGITSGYKNYSAFNADSSIKDNPKTDLSKNAPQDIDDLFKNFQDNVWWNLYDWLQSNWFPKSSSNSSLIIDDSTKIDGWSGIANTHKTYTPPTNNSAGNSGTNNSGSDDSNKGSGTDSKTPATPKQSFAVNLNNYIN